MKFWEEVEKKTLDEQIEKEAMETFILFYKRELELAKEKNA